MPGTYPNYFPSGHLDGQATGVASIIGPGVTHIGEPIYLANTDGTFGVEIGGGGGGGISDISSSSLTLTNPTGPTVNIEGDPVGAASAAQAAAEAYASGLVTYQRLIAQYGEDPTNPGFPNKPWQPEPTIGVNLWQTQFFSAITGGPMNPGGTTLNTTTITPSVTGTTGATGKLTRILLPQLGSIAGGARFRVYMTITTT